ncbi:low affinity immunoglobulin gamma Fc region receptor II-like isoform X2 [Lates japonicus]|nr:low affinity immunoglobulin gamma Fc region receptor II-like isoform X2 [Lates japonicus]
MAQGWRLWGDLQPETPELEVEPTGKISCLSCTYQLHWSIGQWSDCVESREEQPVTSSASLEKPPTTAGPTPTSPAVSTYSSSSPLPVLLPVVSLCGLVVLVLLVRRCVQRKHKADKGEVKDDITYSDVKILHHQQQPIRTSRECYSVAVYSGVRRRGGDSSSE